MLSRRLVPLVLILATMCLTLGSRSFLKAADDVALTAIRQRAAAYVKALNEGDKATLEAIWANDGTFVDAGGAQNARELIAQKFTKELSSQRHSFRNIESRLRLITQDVAIQEGSTEFADEQAFGTRSYFTATWVKRDGNWMLECLHESIPTRPPQNTRFNDLAWLLGEFSGQADDGTNVVVVAAISPDGNFILRDFLVTRANGDIHTLHQRIAWDTIGDSFKSWIFDSDGSYGEGAWRSHGKNWIVTNTGATTAGQPKSAVNLYTHIEPDGFFVEAVGVMLGDESRPNVKVRLTREPLLK